MAEAASLASLVPVLKAQLEQTRQSALNDFAASATPDVLLARLSTNVDAVLMQLWQAANLPSSAALLAVGGYGRGELFPHSDVDVLVLLQDTASASDQARLEELIQALWDLRIEPGHSIRTLDECLHACADHIAVQTSLLEARLLAGNVGLFDKLRKAHGAQLQPLAFFREKTLEMRQRHFKYEDTPYSLEPNCKESPGGMRDLQVILWVTQAAGLGNSWDRLAENGLITSVEARQLRQKEQVFKDIRIRLHLEAGRREDRLVFDLQTPVAESFGFHTTDTRRASEFLMQHYYWAAKAVTQLNTILLQNIEARLSPQPHHTQALNQHFNEVNGFLDIAADDTFQAKPHTMLEGFLLLSLHPKLKGMSARTLRALWHARFRINAAFRREPGNRKLFLQILQAPQGITHTLRRMNDTSILGRYLPAFRQIVGQMQHDLFHVYTVDQHILMVVRNLRRFTLAEHAHEYPFCNQLMARFGQPWLLYIAALFHDIAKGRGGDHSRLGMADARNFCRDHGVCAAETELVVFLVEHHLSMSHTAQKQDLSDPRVIQKFARLVGTEQRLTALYLLTVADIRGTSPKVWNAWKGKLLEELYRHTFRAISGEVPCADRELRTRQDEALRLLRLHGLPDNAHQALWRQLDDAYFLRHDAGDIAWQTRFLHDKTDATQALVKCRLAPVGEGLQVSVYARDQADLFARICAYFERKQFSVLDARIHTSTQGYALDTFLVAAPAFADSYRDIISLVEYELGQALANDLPLLLPCIGRTSRQSRHFPLRPVVDLSPDERGHYYLLSITAGDRPGLLYSIAHTLAMHRINLHSAKIMTMGERVEDSFLIDGAVLNSARGQIQFETDLLAALQPAAGISTSSPTTSPPPYFH